MPVSFTEILTSLFYTISAFIVTVPPFLVNLIALPILSWVWGWGWGWAWGYNITQKIINYLL